MKLIKTFPLVLLLGFILSSCTSNKLLSSWDDKSLEHHNLGKVLVIGVAQNETKRRIYEDTFVSSLTQAGTHAIASYTVTKQSIEPSEKSLREVVKKTGVQSVLITHLVNKNEKDYYQPSNIILGTNSYTPGLYGYYPFVYGSVYASGSYSSTTKVILETSIHDVKTETLIWTARSESTDPVMTRKYYQKLIDLFLHDLSRKNFL